MSLANRVPPNHQKGDRVERDGWIGVVMDTNERGHVFLAFLPRWSGPPRPQEWVRGADWRLIEDAVPTGRNQIQE